jgi:hypothetical protein
VSTRRARRRPLRSPRILDSWSCCVLELDFGNASRYPCVQSTRRNVVDGISRFGIASSPLTTRQGGARALRDSPTRSLRRSIVEVATRTQDRHHDGPRLARCEFGHRGSVPYTTIRRPGIREAGLIAFFPAASANQPQGARKSSDKRGVGQTWMRPHHHQRDMLWITHDKPGRAATAALVRYVATRQHDS